MGPKNILSVDVEDYFQVEAFAEIVNRESWDTYPSRVVANTQRVMELFDECQVKATFFILGWVAERNPKLVQEIARRGHEIACHSYWHRVIYRLSPQEFREDTKRAKDAIEQIAGEPVKGYRAPNFSITTRSAWAPEILAELGFAYDSSVFPVHHDVYGVPNAPRIPFVMETPSGNLLEYPMTTFRVAGKTNFPVGGGGYLRIFPTWYTKAGVKRVWKEGLRVISYIHPWEFDPEQPRLPGKLKSRLRHYTNLNQTASRLRELIGLGDFGCFRDSDLGEGARLGKLA